MKQHNKLPWLMSVFGMIVQPSALAEPLDPSHSSRNQHMPLPLELFVGDNHTLVCSGPVPGELLPHSSRTRRNLLATSKESAAAAATARQTNHLRYNNPNQQNQRKIQQEAAEITNISSENGQLKAQYYFLQALGKSDLGACEHPEPSFTASCLGGGKAFIVKQSSRSPWSARLDCTSLDEHSIFCQPKLDRQTGSARDNNGITMACYGYTSKELQVSVEIQGNTYFCDKALSYTTDPVSVTSGGNVYQTIALQKQCLSSNAQGQVVEDWVFVEPTCESKEGARIEYNENEDGPNLQISTFTIEYETANGTVDRQEETITIAHCELEESCSTEYTCDPKCVGRTNCYTTVPGFLSTSTYKPDSLGASSCEPRDFSLDMPSGELCEFNLMCASDICIDGLCQEERLPNLQPCGEANDCSSGACGRHPQELSATMDGTTVLDRTVCCPSGQVFGFLGETYCTESQPTGTFCHDDEMCDTGICVFNICQEILQDNGMECEESSDCIQGVCALYQGTKLCCPTGQSVFHPEGDMCSNRPDGDVCEDQSNSLCASNVCVAGICQAQQRDHLQTCENNSDCLNDACALESLGHNSLAAATYDTSSPFVCCPSGNYVFLAPQGGDETAGALRVCTGQPTGASCSNQDVDTLCSNGICDTDSCIDSPCANIAAICQSGVCSDGVCQ